MADFSILKGSTRVNQVVEQAIEREDTRFSGIDAGQRRLRRNVIESSPNNGYVLEKIDGNAPPLVAPGRDPVVFCKIHTPV